VRVLVFGRFGQVGRALVDAAPRFGIEATALGRDQVDITDRAVVLDAVGRLRPDAVVNAAAYTAVDRSESDVEAALAVNGAGAGHVAEACRAAGVPLVHVSTDYVFDGRKPAPYVETDPVNPLGAYGRSKLAGERAVADAWSRHLILRTSWVYAPVGHNFVRTMLRLAGERSELSVVDDQHGCPTAAEDLAALVCDLLSRGDGLEGRWGLYHAAGAGVTTWCGFAREIFRQREALTGLAGPVVQAVPTSAYPTPTPRPPNSALDCSRLRATFGVSLPAWPDSLRRCLRTLLTVG